MKFVRGAMLVGPFAAFVCPIWSVGRTDRIAETVWAFGPLRIKRIEQPSAGKVRA